MNVLLVGSNGLLGQNLCQLAPKGVDLFPCGLEEEGFLKLPRPYERLDITDSTAIHKKIDSVQPDWIFNVAAMTNVDQCEREPEACGLINRDAVGWLAQSGVPMVHISTDYIFDGSNGPYREEDAPNPLGVYGQIKLESEPLVLKANAKSLVVRTMLLWGQGLQLRPSFVDFVRSNLEEKKKIRIVKDQIGDPTLASDLATAIWKLVGKNCSGVYHVSGSERLSRYEWATQVADYYGLDPSYIDTCLTSDLGQAAARPLNSGFVLEKLRRDTGFTPKKLKEQLAVLA